MSDLTSLSDPDNVQLEVIGICHTCSRQYTDDPRTCDAYPNGIPIQIRSGEHDHRVPFGGEQEEDGHPILFQLHEASDGDPEDYLVDEGPQDGLVSTVL